MRKARPDFTYEGLPATRRALFIDVIKQRYGSLLRLGLLSLAFALPFLIISFYRDFTLSGYQSALAAGELSQADYEANATVLGNITFLVQGISLALYGISLGGEGYVLRQLSWQEPLFFHEDYTHGLSLNGLRLFFLGLLAGLLYYACAIASLLGIYPSFVSGILYGVLLLFVLPILLYMARFLAIYESGFFSAIKSSFLLYLRSFGKGLLFLAMVVAPFLLFLIPDLLWKYVAFVLVLVFLYPVIDLAGTVLLNGVFDRLTNEESYPDLVNKGLRSKEEKDDER